MMKTRLLCFCLLLCLCAGALLSACAGENAASSAPETTSENLPEAEPSLAPESSEPAEESASSEPPKSPESMGTGVQEESDLYYGDASLPKVTEPRYWPENSPNRQTRINLISGQPPRVRSKMDITGDIATEYYNSLDALPLLTDGKTASRATYSDPALVHFTRGMSRSLYFDFGYTSAVSGAYFSFLQESSTAVNLPEEFSIALSDDGIGWQTVYENRHLTASSDNSYCRTEVKFDQIYAARFVRFTVAVSVHVFCDEIQVFGTKAIPANAVNVVPEEEEIEMDRGYVLPEDFLGVHNVLLSYHCQRSGYGHSESGLITEEEYRPHVGYYNTDGELTDTFFDGYLYLPYTAYNYSDYARTLEGWKFYLDDIFYKNRNMDALNKEVGRTAAALSLPDYRCTVFTSVLYPWVTLSDGSANTFGDLDGDGKNDAFSSLENRKKAVKWMMDQEFDRFRAGGYENLTFGGFYWFEESIAVYSTEEKELVTYAADYAHSLGVKFFWIPYYTASGFDRWDEYGFDVACMQPNYMFGQSGDPTVLKTNAELTKHYGMCVEIEMNNINSDVDVSRYREYLEAGAKYGYMYGVKMYYQGGVPGAFYGAWASNNARRREVYDMTYLFAKEKFGDVPSVTPGDVNGDGRVTDEDVQLLMEALAGTRTLSGDALIAADLNKNGVLDARDAVLILQELEK